MPIHCEERDIRMENATLAAYGMETLICAIQRGQRHDSAPSSPFSQEEKKDVEKTCISYAAEILYCEDSGKHDVPLILARLWMDYLAEGYERAEWSEDGRSNVLASQLEACRMIQEATETMQKNFQNWKSWEELNAEAEAELEALNEE